MKFIFKIAQGSHFNFVEMFHFSVKQHVLLGLIHEDIRKDCTSLDIQLSFHLL